MFAWPIRTDANAISSPMTSVTAANTAAFAASIGVRRGTASRLALIVPVAYSLVITITPRTQMGISAMPGVAPRNPVGSARKACLLAAPIVRQFAMVMAGDQGIDAHGTPPREGA